MRISLLEQREPFGDILCRTLAEFLDKRGLAGHTLRWRSEPPIRNGIAASFGARGDVQRWLCNPYLNAIFLPRTARRNLEPLVRELAGTPIVWRRPLQRVFATVASSLLTAPLLARSFLEVEPAIPGSDDWVIVGGNHKLRILDRPRDRSWVIVKHGRPVACLGREIEARRLAEAGGVPVPAIQEIGDDGSYLAESYVCGTPLNRLARAAARGRGLREIGEALSGFANATRTETTVGDYLETLPLPDTALVADLRHRLEADQSLLVCRAHGDFQDANILAARDRLWLIDWEYSAVRQHGYDPLVYVLGSRFPEGLAQRFHAFVAARPDGLMRLWNNPMWNSALGRRISVDLLALEELALSSIESSLAHDHAPSPKHLVLEGELINWLER